MAHLLSPRGPAGTDPGPPLWLADWTDVEDRAFRRALAGSGQEATIVRARYDANGGGRLVRRLRTYPTYLELALRARQKRPSGAVIAWQPLAGVASALLPGGHDQRLVLLNPLLDPEQRGRRQRMMVAATRLAHRTAFLAHAGLQAAVELGVPAERAEFVRFGVEARRAEPVASTGEFFLAIGRELRDWRTLARAAAGMDREVLVIGPASLEGFDPLRLVKTTSRDETFELMDRASAVIVPLLRSERQAGLLVTLDAFAAGRPVIATRNPATVDYVTADRGRLVDAEDPEALRRAMEELSDPAVTAELGAAALAAAHGPLALHRFIRDLHDLADA